MITNVVADRDAVRTVARLALQGEAPADVLDLFLDEITLVVLRLASRYMNRIAAVPHSNLCSGSKLARRLATKVVQ